MDSEGPLPLILPMPHSTAEDDRDDGGEGIAGWAGDDYERSEDGDTDDSADADVLGERGG